MFIRPLLGASTIITRFVLYYPRQSRLSLTLIQSLADLVDEEDFLALDRSDTRGERRQKLCLAKVDAEILKAAGGVVEAAKIMRRDAGGKQRRAPKKKVYEDSSDDDVYGFLPAERPRLPIHRPRARVPMGFSAMRAS